MTTFHRICIKDFAVTDGTDTAEVQRGKEYLTSSKHEDDTVTVFSRFWFRVPLIHFGGEEQFTGPIKGTS